MSYPLLKQGDRLPSVAALQILLNQALDRGEALVIDGLYGPRTKARVKTFQEQHQPRLTADGIVGQQTWPALTAGQDFQILDAVDVTKAGDELLEVADLRAAGGQPITSQGMCNGIRSSLFRIRSRARHGKLALLRFHGHGHPGSMGVAVGTGGYASSELDVRYIDSVVRVLLPLRTLFAPLGSVEMHGCRVGAGRQGRQLLRGMAYALQTPVTAGLGIQYGGGGKTFHFEGPTLTVCPDGISLTDWAGSLTGPGTRRQSRQ